MVPRAVWTFGLISWFEISDWRRLPKISWHSWEDLPGPDKKRPHGSSFFRVEHHFLWNSTRNMNPSSHSYSTFPRKHHKPGLSLVNLHIFRILWNLAIGVLTCFNYYDRGMGWTWPQLIQSWVAMASFLRVDEPGSSVKNLRRTSTKSLTPKKSTRDWLGGAVSLITHRIHGAAIYGNMDPINIPQSC